MIFTCTDVGIKKIIHRRCANEIKFSGEQKKSRVLACNYLFGRRPMKLVFSKVGVGSTKSSVLGDTMLKL